MLALLPEPQIQFLDANGKPLVGGFLYTCIPGGTITDLKSSWKDAAGTQLNTNPVVLDSAGRATVFLDGFYHVFLEDSTHTAIYDLDNVSSSAFLSAITVQWQLYPAVETYVSGVSFTIPGNVTSDFPLGRRLKATLSASTLYGTVTGISAGGGPVVTTVTVIWDTGSLDATLSAIYTGILTPTNPSIPIRPTVLKNATTTLTVADMNQFIVGSNTVAMNFTLPTSLPSGTWCRIHNAGTNNITLIGTVNGSASPVMNPQDDAAMFFDGSSWWAIFKRVSNGVYTTSLSVGSEGGFPAFLVDNTGDVTVTGGADSIWHLIHGATQVITVGATHGVTIDTRGFMASDPLAALEIATKGYVDTLITSGSSSLSAATAINGLRLVPEPFYTLNPGRIWTAQTAGLSGFSGYYTLGATEGPNPGGWFHNVYIAANCNAYFHFFDAYAAGTVITVGTQYGWRIGYVATSLSATPANAGPWSAGHQPTPSSFSTVAPPKTTTAGTFTDSYDRIVIGPVALTPGWWSFFVQFYASASATITDFSIYGGLFMTLSAT